MRRVNVVLTVLLSCSALGPRKSLYAAEQRYKMLNLPTESAEEPVFGSTRGNLRILAIKALTSRLYSYLRPFARDAKMKALRFTSARKEVNLNIDSTLLSLGTPGHHTFFGYHDLTPFSYNDRQVLACRTNLVPSKPGPLQPLQLGMYELSNRNPTFELFDNTTAWCWQQGSRLQWYPHDSNKTVLFNTTRKGRHVAKIFQIGSPTDTLTIPFPIYSVNITGNLGVSLDFLRLQRLRPGYGYIDLPEKNKGGLAPTNNGLHLINMHSGTGELIFSLAQAASIDPDETMAGAAHYFNHVLWSPCGNQFFFMHLWRGRFGGRFNRAFLYDCSTSETKLLNRGKPVSHHCWVNNTNLIVFTEGTYREIDIYGRASNVIGNGILTEDGHPSMSPISSEILVTDTYPDKLGEQNLLVFNRSQESLLKVASFYSPLKYKGEIRCDLHPRWNRSGRSICVDSAHSGERRLCILNVSSLFTK